MTRAGNRVVALIVGAVGVANSRILLAVIGGVVGVLAGAAAVYAGSKSWAVVIPVEAWSGGIASAILIGAFAGLMPAVGRLGCRPPWHCERHEREVDHYRAAADAARAPR